MSDGQVDFSNLVYIDLDEADFRQMCLLRGDILLNRTNSHELVGKISLFDSSMECLTASYIVAYRLKTGRINPGFCNYLLNTGHWQRRIKVFATIGVSQSNINPTVFQDSLTICLPEIDEQQRIAASLKSIDELIGAEGQKLDALKAHKKGLMQQLFPREGETVPRLRFPEFHRAPKWQECPLTKFVMSLDAGVSVNSGDRPAQKGEAGVLKTSSVTKGVFEPLENKVVLDEDELRRLREPVCGDTIIISRMNTPALVGANAYVEDKLEDIFLPDRLWAAKPKPGASTRFLAFVLGSDKGRAALAKLATGTSGSMKNITKPDVLALPIVAPLLPEQQRIADCLASLDKLLTSQSDKLEALKIHKQGLMQQLFPS